MAANVETMFSVREVPWHGLGRIVQEAPTSKDALELAGLDWIVEGRPLFLENGAKIEGYVANVRNTDNYTLGVVTDKYRVVQNHEAFQFTDTLLGEGVTYETAGSLNHGKKVWLLAKMPSTNILGDEVVPYLVFSNSHNGDSAIRVAMTPVRVVCQNTLNIALGSAQRQWTARHVGKLDSKLNDAKITLGLANQYMQSLKEVADTTAKRAIQRAEFLDFIEALYDIPEDAGVAREDNIILLRQDLATRYFKAPDLDKFRGTVWGVINAVSDHATHMAPLRKTNSYKETNFNNVINGHQLMDKAIKLLQVA